MVEELKEMVDVFNKYANKFHQVRDHVEQGGTPNFSVRLLGRHKRDARMHNLLTCDEVVALIIGDSNDMENGRDVVARNAAGEYKRLYETEPYVTPLQYPLLFPCEEDGFSTNIPIRSVDHGNKKRTRITVTIREWIAYRMQDRVVEYGNVVNSRRLLQQFAVDCYTMIESQRLWYIRKKSKHHKVRHSEWFARGNGLG